MKIIVRTPVSQRRIEAESFQDLTDKIKISFKLENFSLFSDPERTIPFKENELKENSLIFMSYEMKAPEIYKEEKKCDHSSNAVCPKCSTMDPMERNKIDDIKVKYLSYNCYKTMLENSSKNEEIYDYKLKVCEDHPKNVKCMKCMEKVITLVPQVFRRIDYVEFDNKECIESIIDKWRISHRQSIGFLIGKYQEHTFLPQGKKAVVSGIWYIGQESFPDGFVLQEIPNKFPYKGLEILGIIYTDLFSSEGRMKSNKIDRGYLISNVELNFYYDIYKVIKNPDLINICIGANAEGEIVPECFMITEQFKSLMEAQALTMTTDPMHFETKREIKYLIRNEYNKDVPINANPFVPLDYFIVKCEVGFKDNPLFNRYTVIEKSNIRKLSGYFEGEFTLEKCNNFNILMYLSNHIKIDEIFEAVLLKDEEKFNEIINQEEIQNFVRKMNEYVDKKWTCTQCTYLNESYAELCEMCANAKAVEE